MSTMDRWQGLRAHSPYEAPEAEVLVIRFEERFLDGTYNKDNNETVGSGDPLDLGD